MGELQAEATPHCSYSPIGASGFLRHAALPECPVCLGQELPPLPHADESKKDFTEFSGWEN